MAAPETVLMVIPEVRVNNGWVMENTCIFDLFVSGRLPGLSTVMRIFMGLIRNKVFFGPGLLSVHIVETVAPDWWPSGYKCTRLALFLNSYGHYWSYFLNLSPFWCYPVSLCDGRSVWGGARQHSGRAGLEPGCPVLS